MQALNQDSARMRGVTVTVGTAQPQPIDIRAHIWRSANASPTLLADLQAHLQTQLAARAALGSPIARSWITTLLHIDGRRGRRPLPQRHRPAPHHHRAGRADEYPTLGKGERCLRVGAMTAVLPRSILPPQSTPLERAIDRTQPQWDAIVAAMDPASVRANPDLQPWLAMQWQVAQFGLATLPAPTHCSPPPCPALSAAAASVRRALGLAGLRPRRGD